jgi:hypothetical protein
MSATFEWHIMELQAVPALNNLTNVVRKIFWICTGTENIGGNDYQISRSATAYVTYDEANQFIEFSQLTESIILGWVWSQKINNQPMKEVIESEIQIQLTNEVAPKEIPMMPPWLAPNPSSNPT